MYILSGDLAPQCPLTPPKPACAEGWSVREANSSLSIRPGSSSLSTDGEEVTFALFACDPNL